MTTVEALVRVRPAGFLPGPGQKADGDIIIVQAVGDTLDKDELVALWDKPTLDAQWLAKYPILAAKADVQEATTKGQAEKVQWIADKVDPDGGLSSNWGKLDLKRHVCIVIENWPTTLDNGAPLPFPTAFPLMYELGGQHWHTRINVDYTAKLKAAQVADIKEPTKWLKPIKAGAIAGTGIDFTDPLVTQVHTLLPTPDPVVTPKKTPGITPGGLGGGG